VLSVSVLLLLLLIGMFVVDADAAMQKKAEVKALLEMANHHATFAVNQDLKTEGVIDLVEEEALARFDRRMEENGGYTRQGSEYVPAADSVTTDTLPFVRYSIDFLNWRKDLHLRLRYTGDTLLIEQATTGAERPTGGRLRITVVTERNEELELAPKTMIGPCAVVVAYVDERPFLPLLPAHSFPVVSVEELKW
jgi:hypothetical protein